MFKIEKNPIADIEDKFELVITLLKFNHVKSDQQMVISLEADQTKQVYMMRITFKEYVGYTPNGKADVFKMDFPIVKTDGFNADNAKIAYQTYLKYCKEDEQTFANYINIAWSQFHLNYKISNELPKEIKDLLSSSDLSDLESLKVI